MAWAAQGIGWLGFEDTIFGQSLWAAAESLFNNPGFCPQIKFPLA